MTDNLNLYLEQVASYVNDDDKLVTYKWLSKELEVHINDAKNILQKYYDNNKDNVVATYLIKGQLKDGSLRMEVSKANDVDVAKQKFTTLDFEHIYSVQKTLPDIELLGTAGDGDVHFSAIKLDKNPLRIVEVPQIETTEIDKIESKKVEKIAEEKPKANVEDKLKKEEKENKEQKEEKVVKKDKSEKIKQEITKNNSKSNKKPVQSSQTGFNNLFGKVTNQKKNVNFKTTSSKEEKPKSPIKTQAKDEEPKNKETPEINNSSPEKPQAKTKSAPAKKSQSKKRTRSPAKKEVRNKRKRIVVASDSSEDEAMQTDHSEEEEPEEIIKESPSQNKFSRRSPTPEPVKTECGKIKIRKVITQSYEDEDGYILTKQVTVTEEVDAEPEPALKPKKVEPTTKKQAKKQASITSFFKRS